jgi:hypothetical protein
MSNNGTKIQVKAVEYSNVFNIDGVEWDVRVSHQVKDDFVPTRVYLACGNKKYSGSIYGITSAGTMEELDFSWATLSVGRKKTDVIAPAEICSWVAEVQRDIETNLYLLSGG